MGQSACKSSNSHGAQQKCHPDIPAVHSVVVSPVVSSVRDFPGQSSSSSNETDECTRAAREFAQLGPAPVGRITEWMQSLPPKYSPIVEKEVVSNGEAEYRIWRSVDATADTWDIEEEKAMKASGARRINAIDLESPPNSVQNDGRPSRAVDSGCC